MAAERSEKVRVQFDVTLETETRIRWLQKHLACRSRADLMLEALRLFSWAAEEIRAGQRVVSLDPVDLAGCPRYKELVSPSFAPLIEPAYTYLVNRPHPWRRQMWVKGKNMTAGQLVYTLRTEGLSPKEGAEDLDLPLEAIQEALEYYQSHRELIEMEAAEEKRRLGEKGYSLEA